MTREQPAGYAGYNVRLLFGAEINGRLKTLSQKLAAAAPSSYVLGEDSVPHITLLRFAPEAMDAQKLLEAVQRQVLDVAFDVGFTGFWTAQDGDDGMWHGLKSERTLELIQLRNGLLDALQGASPPHAPERDFLPHVTLGRINPADLARVTAALEGESLLRAQNIRCALSVVSYSATAGYTGIF